MEALGALMTINELQTEVHQTALGLATNEGAVDGKTDGY
jgi:hypothetical protein